MRKWSFWQPTRHFVHWRRCRIQLLMWQIFYKLWCTVLCDRIGFFSLADLHAKSELHVIILCASRTQRSRLLDNTERLERSGKRLEDGYRTCIETEQIGSQVLEDLHSQRQTIQRSRDRVCTHVLNQLSSFNVLCIYHDMVTEFISWLSFVSRTVSTVGDSWYITGGPKLDYVHVVFIKYVFHF